MQGIQQVAGVEGNRAAAGYFGCCFGSVLAQLRSDRTDTELLSSFIDVKSDAAGALAVGAALAR